jgi:hypothetical protein
MHERRTRPLLIAVTLLLTVGALAQPTGVEFELGIGGALVEGAWNPLRLTVRDLPAGELELRLDQGSLRSGPIIQRYLLNVPASSGVAVFDDEVFLPPWRSFTWTLRSAGRAVASGGFDARSSDSRPLTLVLSAEPSRWLTAFPPDTRFLEVGAGGLPSRAASYSGAAGLLIDGTSHAPTVESVVTAAAAGVTVVVVTPLAPTHAHLAPLLSPVGRRVGAGWLVSATAADAAGLVTSRPGFPTREVAQVLLEREPPAQAPALSRFTLVSAAGIYTLLVVALLRFGGGAGVVTAAVAALLSGAAAWTVLRPEQPLVRDATSLVVNAGGLGIAVGALSVLSLPGGEVAVERPMRVNVPLPHTVTTAGTTLMLNRWQREELVGRPVLTDGGLEWRGDRLHNSGRILLEDVIVIGLGPQSTIPGGSSIEAIMSEETVVPLAYQGLLELLPAGSALARGGSGLFIALPASGTDDDT